MTLNDWNRLGRQLGGGTGHPALGHLKWSKLVMWLYWGTRSLGWSIGGHSPSQLPMSKYRGLIKPGMFRSSKGNTVKFLS